MRVVFRRHMNVPSKNAHRDCEPGARSAEGALRGVLSFGDFSLHKQRKVTRVSGSFCFEASGQSESQGQNKSQSFRLAANVADELCSLAIPICTQTLAHMPTL
ncbi:hypothetical protein XACN24_00755 [Xanthomonas albilineans]|uniref:hypothetical protein n=2 Tax=Xanthomonas albilineans TaxID=29447 RepID=UPI0012D4ACCB|nr:hypothetical protein [Xanthomonas albilineans]